MNPMLLSSQKLLRLFVLLLLTVFVTETVYASGMMTIADLSANQAEKQDGHCHEHGQSLTSASSQGPQVSQKQSSSAHSKTCSHCFACYSIIVPATLSACIAQQQMIASTPFLEIYHAPTSAQPQKPPIA